MSALDLSADALDPHFVERPRSFFADDLAENQARLREVLRGRRVLVVGGAGSIGSMTARLLIAGGPSAVHVIDISENYLAELVRDIRSSGDVPAGLDLRMLPVDYGGPIAERFIRNEAPYDIVLNFAALKHVRSEKDVYSLLQMLDTNVVRQARFKQWIVDRGGSTRYFGISTDKAANPTSLMGATKRLMEDVLFGVAQSPSLTVTSARFANVLFSNGSLPQGWLRRIELGQPLAAPRDTRRYFVTRAEAGEICLMASLLGEGGDIFIPRLDPERELRLLEDMARKLLRLHDLEAVVFTDEAEARAAVASLRRDRRWPLLLTPLDTSGEKPYEEFVGRGESAREIGMSSLMAIRHTQTRIDAQFLTTLQNLIGNAHVAASKADIVAAISSVIPNFQHVETEKSLDQRM